MNNQEFRERAAKDILLIEADEDANRFNIRCMAILAFFSALSYLLEKLGLFTLPERFILACSSVGLLLFALPGVIYLIHDVLLRSGKPILKQPGFKYLILTFAFFGVALLSIILTHHAVLLLAVPPLLAAQYHDRRKLFFRTLILTMLLVPISIYGGFFFGSLDRNLLKGILTDDEAAVLANRLAIATPKRMKDLLFHYTIPRLLCMVAVVLLADGIVRRNAKMLARQDALSRRVQEDMEHITRMQSEVINALAAIIENRDADTGEHVIRTKRFVEMLMQAMRAEDAFRDRLPQEEIDRIAAAAPLHDVGKITVSDVILMKPAKLTPEEFETIKTHTVKGREIIRKVFRNLEDEALLRTAEDIAMSHHEKWDGSGYPQGLKGEEIPLSARIMAVADVFDALCSVRVYKDAIPPQKAVDVMMEQSGTHFDPEIMRVFWEIRSEIVAYAGRRPETAE